MPHPLERFAERISGYYRMDRNSPVIGAIARASHELLGERMEGVLMPWDGKHSLESNWPNEDSGWMGEVFRKSVPDFHWERFETWIEQIYETRDPELLLRAPLCTSANVETPTVKQPMVVGDEMMLPVPKPGADADASKGKEELDGSRPLADPIPIGTAWKLGEEELDEVFQAPPTGAMASAEYYENNPHLVDPDIMTVEELEDATFDTTDRSAEAVRHRNTLEEVVMAKKAQKVVEAAAKLVPMVGEGGKRVRRTAATSAKKTGAKAPAAGEPKPKLDPRTWTDRKSVV